MKRFLLVFAAVALLALPALAQNPNYRLELSADANQSSCGLNASDPGVVSIHVFLKGDAPSTGLLFSLYRPGCFSSAVWVDDHTAQPWATIGSTQVPLGLSIGFGDCEQLPLYIGHFDFITPGGTASCCQFDVTHPTSWTYYTEPTLVTDCDFAEWRGSAQGLIINPTTSCPCGTGTFLATEQSSWGQVKALYR